MADPITGDGIAQAHIAEVQLATERGRWQGRVEARLDGHDREFNELRGLIGSVVTEQQGQGKLIMEVHTGMATVVASTAAVELHQQNEVNAKWSSRNFVIGICLAAASIAGTIGTVLALVIR